MKRALAGLLFVASTAAAETVQTSVCDVLRSPASFDGKTVRLWAQDHEGWLTMDATATLR